MNTPICTHSHVQCKYDHTAHIYRRHKRPPIAVVSLVVQVHGGARGVMVIVGGNEHGDTSSNPRQN